MTNRNSTTWTFTIDDLNAAAPGMGVKFPGLTPSAWADVFSAIVMSRALGSVGTNTTVVSGDWSLDVEARRDRSTPSALARYDVTVHATRIAPEAAAA